VGPQEGAFPIQSDSLGAVNQLLKAIIEIGIEHVDSGTNGRCDLKGTIGGFHAGKQIVGGTANAAS
jgi:hypothetical protein